MAAIICYLVVSTNGQGEIGLGLEMQRAAVESYARQTGATLVVCYTEVESGKLADCPALAKVLAHARRSTAPFVLAKLDHLARNVAFLSALMDSIVPFIACDNPHENRLTLHILAAVAEAEARLPPCHLGRRDSLQGPWGKLGAELPECRKT
jgi:DNA invertase Pin-like site-specific DNA recombinase